LENLRTASVICLTPTIEPMLSSRPASPSHTATHGTRRPASERGPPRCARALDRVQVAVDAQALAQVRVPVVVGQDPKQAGPAS
jgi:hypothetical protein